VLAVSLGVSTGVLKNLLPFYLKHVLEKRRKVHEFPGEKGLNKEGLRLEKIQVDHQNNNDSN